MNQKIYQPPKSETIPPIEKRLKTGKVLSIIGAILNIGIIWGFVTFALSLYESFETITLYGEGDTEVMAGMISSALVYQIIGSIISLPGVIISSVALFISSYRSRILNTYLIVISIFWMLTFPFGTLFGLIFLTIVLIRKNR